MRQRIADWAGGIPRRELALLAAAMAATLAFTVAYVLLTRDNPLVGDQPEYDMQGRFFTDGKLWWSTTPFDIAHASMWKAPGYPAWVGFWYLTLGDTHVRVELVQAVLLGPLTVALTWLLARRLFGPAVALASAWVVAALPLVWEYFGLLYAEALAIPLTLGVLVLFLDRDPTPRLAVFTGLALGASLLVRPTSVFLAAGVLAAWWVACGIRRGVALTAIAVLTAALVVLPWTIRNYVVTDGGFVPISIQDGALAGTFNETSASDPKWPYAWRPNAPEEVRLFRGPPLDDATLRARLNEIAYDYIEEHPASVVKAFFWNGLSRFWDVRTPARALDEPAFEGRSKTLGAIGLAMYWLLLPLALVGLWRLRSRRTIVVPVLAMAAAASVVFTVVSATRYRAPLEPLIAILACYSVAASASRRRARTATPRRSA